MVVGQSLTFGVTSDVASLVTQKVAATSKSDKKMARNKSGIVVAVAFYNKTTDISVDGLGVATNTIGSSITLGTGFTMAGSAAYVDEVTHNQGNEDFENSTIKATSYEGI